MARAMLYADATVVVPMDFLRVPLTATAGWLIYAERLDCFTVLGRGADPGRQSREPEPTRQFPHARGNLSPSLHNFRPANL